MKESSLEDSGLIIYPIDIKWEQLTALTMQRLLIWSGGTVQLSPVEKYAHSPFLCNLEWVHGSHSVKPPDTIFIDDLINTYVERPHGTVLGLLEYLMESVEEMWNHSIPACWGWSNWKRKVPPDCEQKYITQYPQPSYSVGFKREAFSYEQQGLLDRYIRKFGGTCSPITATSSMYFPF
ncbi:uncharacterized protein V1516DRAFT_666642 [Lipomyces oligophaga]|uniref:uncharacterized protein n=1 Tax=Lipomyces oligophaga TaxID=45792 RepID=UPI0034CEA403